MQTAQKPAGEKPEAKTESPQPRRCYRFSQADRRQSGKRGQARGLRSRYALRNLPPLEDE